MDNATKEYLKILESKINESAGQVVSEITNAEIDTIVAS